MTDRLRDLPSVEALLQDTAGVGLTETFGRPLVVEAIRFAISDTRNKIRAETIREGELSLSNLILREAEQIAKKWTMPSLVHVINATGVILHTNLGRAPLSRAAIQAIEQAGTGYSNLEYDLDRGSRGSRLVHAEDLLKRITGAEASLVVNNNASALLLTLTALARRKRVLISRSQLIEIGGGFRIPEVMSQSGARLVEVGTTNRVHLRDYQAELQESDALILRAHQSNFRIIGFTTQPTLVELARLAHERQTYLIDDLGSGVLLDTARYGLDHEPTVQESLAAGADLVCFSGDKLLGGPQAGILIGKENIIAKLKKHPLARAVRADKLCLAGLSATLLHYLKDEAEREIPIWKMISTPLDTLRSRAESWAASLGRGAVIAGRSTVGGGSLPEETLPTSLLSLKVEQPNQFLGWLREQTPPIIARVEDGRVVLDPRTVLLEEEGALLAGVRSALAEQEVNAKARNTHRRRYEK